MVYCVKKNYRLAVNLCLRIIYARIVYVYIAVIMSSPTSVREFTLFFALVLCSYMSYFTMAYKHRLVKAARRMSAGLYVLPLSFISFFIIFNH